MHATAQYVQNCYEINREVSTKFKSFSMSSHFIMKEAERRGWKTKILNHENHLVALLPSNSDRTILFRRTTSELSTALGLVIANDKMLTHTIATDTGVPMPASLLFAPDHEGFTTKVLDFLHTHGRVVVKPIDCAGGIGVTTTVTDEASLYDAIAYAKQFSKNIMIQAYVTGDDYRLLVLNGRVIAVARRCPPFVIGDGMTTIRQLIEIENAQASRGSLRCKPMKSIDSNEVQDYIAIDQMNNIPYSGQEIQLLGVANASRGGVTYDVTESVHPSILRLAEKITNAAYLSLCGVDMLISGDVSKPIGSGSQPIVIEINATPALRLHHLPAGGGHARNFAAAVLDEVVRRRVLDTGTTFTSTITKEQSYRATTNQIHDVEHFAEIIPDPETFLSLSDAEREFYVKDAI